MFNFNNFAICQTNLGDKYFTPRLEFQQFDEFEILTL